jgi:hypothetical protein
MQQSNDYVEVVALIAYMYDFDCGSECHFDCDCDREG